MAFEQLEQQIRALGPRPGSPFGPERQHEVESRIGAPLPAALAWWWSTFGGGWTFEEAVTYFDPRARGDVLLGWLLDADEVLEVLEDYSGALAPGRVPFINDGGDNFLVVDVDGSVHTHLHDALLDRNSYWVADSLEQLVRGLRASM